MKIEANKKLFPHHLPSILLDRCILIHDGPNLKPAASHQQGGFRPVNGFKNCYLKFLEHLRTIMKSFLPVILGTSKNQCLKYG